MHCKTIGSCLGSEGLNDSTLSFSCKKLKFFFDPTQFLENAPPINVNYYVIQDLRESMKLLYFVYTIINDDDIDYQPQIKHLNKMDNQKLK